MGSKLEQCQSYVEQDPDLVKEEQEQALAKDLFGDPDDAVTDRHYSPGAYAEQFNGQQ